MKSLTGNMQQLIGSGHPVLDTVAKYYTQSEGKHIRPMLVLLISQATAPLWRSIPDSYSARLKSQEDTTSTFDINEPLSPPSVLTDHNPSAESSPLSVGLSTTQTTSNILPSQIRLAEITEVIHTASLLHDDVLDAATTRRSMSSANTSFGNKMAVMAGDFLLGRASVSLARLRNPEVTELLATVIANLIEGEFMQLRNTALDEASPTYSDEDTMAYYLRKTYLKSASLISKSCRAAALLGNCSAEVVDSAYSYGRNLGLAFQLLDDILDYTTPSNSSEQLGKLGGVDLQLGLATAPLLFAWRSRPELGPLVGRKFCEPGDVQKARELVAQSDGIKQTRALAQDFADKAIDALRTWPETEARRGLEEMCERVVKREK